MPNPFDGRASRLHCDAISVSCLDFDDAAEMQSTYLPDDICALAKRCNHFEFVDGSFLGRSEVFENPLQGHALSQARGRVRVRVLPVVATASRPHTVRRYFTSGSAGASTVAGLEIPVKLSLLT